jgi:multiple sugar transport system substrate-binding protein
VRFFSFEPCPAFLAKQEPDIIFSNIFAQTLLWPENGLTVPLEDYLKDWGMDGDFFLDGAIKNYTNEEGHLIALPLEGFYWPIWYNTKAFEAAGVEIPKTQEELIAIAPALREAGYQPFVVGGSDWTGLNWMMLQFQGCMEDEEGLELAANGGWSGNANALKCAELFVQMRDSGVFADNTEGLEFSSMNASFFDGKAAMMHGGSWSYGDLPEEMKSHVVVAGFPPAADSPQAQPVYYGSFNAKGVWVTRNGAEKMDAVSKFVQFLYQPANIARFVEDTGMAPPLQTINVDEGKLSPQFVQSLSLAKENHVLDQPEVAFPAEIFGEVERVLREAFIPNGLSAQQILEALDALY